MMMKDRKIEIYDEFYVHLFGEIRNGCLNLTSLVFGDDYDSEKNYVLSRKDTEKLFGQMSVDAFVEYCQKGRLFAMENLFRELDIHPSTMVW